MESKRQYWRPGQEAYEIFLEGEEIPIYDEYYVKDVATLEVDDWERTGGKGAVLHLIGNGHLNDVHVHEIPPGSSLDEQSHLYEEIIYVVSGNGATLIRDDDEEYMFEWAEDSLFCLPRGVTYKHINQSDEPVRLISNTDLPTLFSLFDEESIFAPSTVMAAQPSLEYSDEGTLHEVPGVPVVWESNFVPDISIFDKLGDYSQRGASGSSVKFNFPGTKLRAHISEFPVGSYKKGHKHKPGANVLILKGEGYTLMWSPENPEDRMRIDWEPGALVPPPTLWYHQHFNLSDEPARYLALHPPSVIPSGPDNVFVPGASHNQIEYTEEDPEIRELYQEELEKHGLEFRMPESCYEEPEYQFDQQYEPVVDE